MTIAIARRTGSTRKQDLPPACPGPGETGQAALSRTERSGTSGSVTCELESGARLPDVALGYETWGTLNADALQCSADRHALTGDTHVTRGESGEPGWWEQLAGPGAPVDTDKYFVVSINILGGCYGSTGPSTRPPTGAPGDHGSRWSPCGTPPPPRPGWRTPWASGAGTRCWAVRSAGRGPLNGPSVSRSGPALRCDFRRRRQHRRTDRFRAGTDPCHPPGPPPQGRGLHGGPEPEAGLALARRIAHITYRSAAELDGRFGRNAQDSEAPWKPDRWPGAAATRWRATWTTRAANWSGVSTRTATSPSPKPS